MKALVVIIGCAVFLAFLIWWNVYAYRDCRNVGHTKFYCVMRIGK